MESPNNFKTIKDFLTKKERKDVLECLAGLQNTNSVDGSVHIETISKELNGNSHMFDISKTEISKQLSNFQSGNTIQETPEILIKIQNKIADVVDISTDNVFVQLIEMNEGGRILPHYDSSVEGYVNYKCNISVLSEDYNFYVDNSPVKIKENDFYAFEASLYKHHTDRFNNKRILLSYGFILPYAELGRNKNDYRVNLSRRIIKYFQ
jgi:hypothetical protein